MERKNLSIFLPFLVFAGTLAALADPAVDSGPCSGDVKQYCGSITPGEGRVAACLKANDDKISAGCKSSLQAATEKYRELRKTCRLDVRKFCLGTQPGQGRVLSCLKEHEGDLSSACKNELTQFGQKPPFSTG